MVSPGFLELEKCKNLINMKAMLDDINISVPGCLIRDMRSIRLVEQRKAMA